MDDTIVVSIVIFTLATFLGVALINRVPPTLHTPLMSGANAVSGITIVGALIVAGGGYGWISQVLGFSAIVFAMMNVAGGYAVTDRMLAMFKKKPGDR
ncbi:MAG TPA: NAD(P) transhydrogenase subunit alpha [Gemmatimonadales bacterium]|nr:NAD(P) transhydrogenase subunit alpha [Gemmatimonadales bacterium]